MSSLIYIWVFPLMVIPPFHTPKVDGGKPKVVGETHHSRKPPFGHSDLEKCRGISWFTELGLRLKVWCYESERCALTHGRRTCGFPFRFGWVFQLHGWFHIIEHLQKRWNYQWTHIKPDRQSTPESYVTWNDAESSEGIVPEAWALWVFTRTLSV